jgi:hypothetical protein
VNAKLKQFGLIEHDNLSPDLTSIGRLPDLLSDEKREYINEIYVSEKLFIVRFQRKFSDGRVNGRSQFEMPIEALSWTVDAIEEMFERKPSQGGLAKDVQHLDQKFDGEELELRYGVSVAGEGVGGYTLTNFSRDCYILPGEAAQTFSFALSIWQDHARDMFKDIIRRYQAGEFV